ncbi:hypothetical protein DRN69_05085 [Candidatus Pacearchaeota archaeon]|nr:MAG: hypothetical protein DRN69_05085 [Candidatus Pacearchaeota archaeon]
MGSLTKTLIKVVLSTVTIGTGTFLLALEIRDWLLQYIPEERLIRIASGIVFIVIGLLVFKLLKIEE